MMLPPVHPARAALLVFLAASPALGQVVGTGGGVGAGVVAPPPLIAGFDEHTVVLGQFEGTLALETDGGSNLIRSTGHTHGQGVYGTAGLVLPGSGVVSLYESEGFDPLRGTLELWVRLGSTAGGQRRTLFSLEGVNTLDGDAFNDLFVGQAVNGDPTWSEIRFGTPAGPSATDVALVKTFMPRGVSAGDVDGDGKHDLVISQNQIDEVQVFDGPLRPGFVYDTPVDPARRLPVSIPQGHALGDLDNDGDLDILVSSYDGDTPPIVGFENDGSGRFTELGFDFGPIQAFAEGMAVGDVDRDGVLDVAFGSLDTAVPSAVFLGSIVHNHYTIGVTNPRLFSARSASALGVTLADIDGDGWLDSLLARTFDNEVAVHLNRGNGSFFPLPNYVIPCTRPFTVTATEDVNNDGWLDVVVAEWKQDQQTTGASRIFLGPDFSRSKTFAVQDAVSMTLGDLDGNGTHDVFWRSSTADESPLYRLDLDGDPVGQSSLPTTPTTPGTAGPGMGVYASIAGGTSPYTTVLDHSNSFELYVVDGQVVFSITDRTGKAHVVAASFADDGPTLQGWRHVAAEWNTSQGRMALTVSPTQGAGTQVDVTGPPIPVTTVHPWMRLGTDFDNQRPCRDCRFDDVRVSDVERSKL